MTDSNSYATQSSAPAHPDVERVGDHLVIDVAEWCPGPHPEPHLRYDGQTSYLERYLRCIRCEVEALRVIDFPPECDGPAFRRGEAVVDEQQPEALALVVDPYVGRGNTHTIRGYDQTVAEFETNAEYPSDDRVVRVCYVDWLDAYVPGWRDWNEVNMAAALGEYSREYGVSIRSYDFPESRLRPANRIGEPEMATTRRERTLPIGGEA